MTSMSSMLALKKAGVRMLNKSQSRNVLLLDTISRKLRKVAYMNRSDQKMYIFFQSMSLSLNSLVTEMSGAYESANDSARIARGAQIASKHWCEMYQKAIGKQNK